MDTIMTTISSGVVLAAAALGFIVLAVLFAGFFAWLFMAIFQTPSSGEPQSRKPIVNRFRNRRRHRPGPVGI